MNYELAYRVGFHPWEDAEDQPAFVEKMSELVSRVEVARGTAPGRALDLGTGSGIWGVLLAKRAWQGTGVDLVESALVRARERAREAGIEAAFPGWHVEEAGPTEFKAPKPVEVLFAPGERWYRLTRA